MPPGAVPTPGTLGVGLLMVGVVGGAVGAVGAGVGRVGGGEMSVMGAVVHLKAVSHCVLAVPAASLAQSAHEAGAAGATPGCWMVPIGVRSNVGWIVGVGLGDGLVPTTIGCCTACCPIAQHDPAWHKEIYLMINASKAAMRSFRSLEPELTAVVGAEGATVIGCGVPGCVSVVGLVDTGRGVALTPK